MRNLALSVAAILVLAIASPAFAQPFADVPTDHWAFDAIAELAAKGIIEGFPDGTFKGDRGVSRYEVAIIVARILARIEAIKIPAPTPAAAPQVTRTDVQTIQRLVNEFRAELAALGVRTTAVEEELTALKASTSATRVTGDVDLRYDFYPSGSPTGSSSAVTRFRDRLTFTGTVSSNIKLVARARFNRPFAAPTGSLPTMAFDKEYISATNLLGFNWQAGQWGYELGSGVGYSGYGLLLDPGNAGINYAGNNALGYVDGLTVGGSLAGFQYELGGWLAATTMNIYTVHVGTALSGWTVGLDGIYQQRGAGTLVPVEVATTTAGALSAVATAGNDTGYSLGVTGALFPGLTLGAAYATFNPGNTSVAGGSQSSNAYIGWVGYDLSPMGMAGWKATAWYKNYGSSTAGTQIPFWSGATTEADLEALTGWNFNGWGVALDADLGSGWSGTFTYESGNQTVATTPTIVEYQAILGYALAPNTKVTLNWFKGTVGGTDYDNWYRLEVTTSY